MERPLDQMPDVKVLRPDTFGDARGFFSEVYNRARYTDLGIADSFVQDNFSLSRQAGTLRGLHFQAPPKAQSKLVFVLSGRILDVVVDLRAGSPTYGDHAKIEISYDAWNQIYIPVGFAHGFCTLCDDVAILYKVSDFYAPDHDYGVHWQDPDLAIDWPVDGDTATVSGRDRSLPRLTEIETPFTKDA